MKCEMGAVGGTGLIETEKMQRKFGKNKVRKMNVLTGTRRVSVLLLAAIDKTRRQY